MDQTQMNKPLYLTSDELVCGVIKFNDKTYLVDAKDKDNIINSGKKFVFANQHDIYPSYAHNYKRFSYVNFIFGYNNDSLQYDFKNGNQYDLRRSNVEFYHAYHANVVKQYNVIEYIQGHQVTVGHDAYKMKNPMWRVNENGKEIILMYCEKDTLCKICPESYKKMVEFEANHETSKKITWHKHVNGYIVGNNQLYIHQVITGCYGNGKGTKNVSVDHIDQDPLNNTMSNLREATRKEQEDNSNGIKSGTKRERKSNARELPSGITQQMMCKYVVYYQEWLDKEHTRTREYFKVEKHPKLDKHWMTTKSGKVSIQEKLQSANKVVCDLENDVYPVSEEPILPKYMSLVITRGKPHLVYERRLDDKRLNVKMVLPEDYDLEDQIVKLNDKIKVKYENNAALP
jgi:hypothetical protein